MTDDRRTTDRRSEDSPLRSEEDRRRAARRSIDRMRATEEEILRIGRELREEANVA